MKRYSITETQLNRLKTLTGSNEAHNILDSLPIIEGLTNLEYATGGIVETPTEPSIYGEMYGLFADSTKEAVLPKPPTKPKSENRTYLEELQAEKLAEIEFQKAKRKAEIAALGRSVYASKKSVPEIKVWVDEASPTNDKKAAEAMSKYFRDAMMNLKGNPGDKSK